MSSKMAPLPFSNFFRQEFRSSTFSWHLHVFASSSASHTSIPIPRTTLFDASSPLFSGPQRSTFFFWLWLELFRIFPFLHPNSESYPQTARLHTRPLSLSCFIRHCSCFCQLASLLITFVDEPLELRHLSFFFVRCAFTRSTSTDMPLFTNSCDDSENFPQICICGS